MAASLVVMLCIAVVISAVAAERSARAHHRFRAVCLNLFGIGCLGVGLLSLYAWCHGDAVVVRQIALAQTETNPGTLVRLFVDSDQSATQTRPEEPAASADHEPGTLSEVDDPAIELPAEDTDQARPDQDDLDLALPDDMMSQVQIDFAARPEWVDREPRDVGPVHQVSVCSDPYRSQGRARHELALRLKQATDEYINELLDSATAAHWIAFDESRIRQTLVSPANIYDEKVISPSVGVMHQSHALLEFGPEFHRDIEHAWRQIVARARLVKFALVAATVLGTLALLLSYFQADTATRGFYTGRLKFATLVAILGLIASGVLLARSIPWLWP